MNEHENKKNMMYETIPAVAKLNKVPGFDPLQFLRPVVSEKTHEKLLKLDLRYQKLWFRLAHPQGRMKVTALRITDKMAIFEAKVFLGGNDNEPASNFIASLTREDTLNYIKEAQETALSTALQDAGFGLQFTDVSVGRSGERYGSAIPAVDEHKGETSNVKKSTMQPFKGAAETSSVLHEKVPAEATKEPLAASVDATAPITDARANPAMQSTVESLPANEQKEEPEEHLPVSEAAPEFAVVESMPTASVEQDKVTEHLPAEPIGKEEQLPVARADETGQADSLPVSQTEQSAQQNDIAGESKTVSFTSLTAATPTSESAPATNEANEPAAKENAAPIPVQGVQTVAAMPRYTADMPMEDIAALMTYEEARAVKVDTGICNGWTIGQVADERTPSLKFYLYGLKGNNNILRAAAKVMLDSMTEQKAG
ncbi:MAG: hypothetical protein LBQ71_19850 [Hungatella sp.]|jgi:hypothetical protein|nr:hypothetical protein [Hungatella sp.]